MQVPRAKAPRQAESSLRYGRPKHRQNKELYSILKKDCSTGLEWNRVGSECVEIFFAVKRSDLNLFCTGFFLFAGETKEKILLKMENSNRTEKWAPRHSA